MRAVTLLATSLFLVACANPLNQVTSDNYSNQCAQDEDAGDLAAAEQACYRALVNVDIGDLGPREKSEKLYNLGRIKRQLGKFSQAEDLFKQSLALEETLSGPSSILTGRRLVELSVSLAAQGKWDEGAQYLQRVIPISSQFTMQERGFTQQTFGHYAEQMRVAGHTDLADKFASAAAELGK